MLVLLWVRVGLVLGLRWVRMGLLLLWVGMTLLWVRMGLWCVLLGLDLLRGWLGYTFPLLHALGLIVIVLLHSRCKVLEKSINSHNKDDIK